MIIFMGVSGAGKSVQGKLLASDLGYEWLSTGQYLRNNVTDERREQMQRGNLLDDNEIIDILKQFFTGIEDKSKVIIDGFPRTINQAKWLVDQHKNGEIKISGVVYLDASKEVVKQRMLSRGREDDNEEVISRRFDEYERATQPIIDWFKGQGVNFYEINAERSVEEIHKDILSKFK